PCGLEEPVDHDARETGSDGRSVIPVPGDPITGGRGVSDEGRPCGGALIRTRGARDVRWGLVDLPGRLESGGVTGEEEERGPCHHVSRCVTRGHVEADVVHASSFAIAGDGPVDGEPVTGPEGAMPGEGLLAMDDRSSGKLDRKSVV